MIIFSLLILFILPSKVQGAVIQYRLTNNFVEGITDLPLSRVYTGETFGLIFVSGRAKAFIWPIPERGCSIGRPAFTHITQLMPLILGIRPGLKIFECVAVDEGAEVDEVLAEKRREQFYKTVDSNDPELGRLNQSAVEMKEAEGW